MHGGTTRVNNFGTPIKVIYHWICNIFHNIFSGEFLRNVSSDYPILPLIHPFWKVRSVDWRKGSPIYSKQWSPIWARETEWRYIPHPLPAVLHCTILASSSHFVMPGGSPNGIWSEIFQQNLSNFEVQKSIKNHPAGFQNHCRIVCQPCISAHADFQLWRWPGRWFSSHFWRSLGGEPSMKCWFFLGFA